MSAPKWTVSVALLLVVRVSAQDIDPKRREQEKNAIPVLRQLPTPADPQWGPRPRNHGVLAELFSARQIGALAVAFSPTANVLAMRSVHRISLWDLDKGKELRTLPCATYPQMFDLEGGRKWRNLVYSPDGKQLAVGDYADKMDLVDVDTGKIVRTLDSPGAAVEIVFSSDGALLSAVMRKRVNFVDTYTLSVWKIATGERKDLQTSEKSRPTWAFSRDGKRAAFATQTPEGTDRKKREIEVWNLESGTKKNLDTNLINSRLAFTPDGQSLAVAASNASPPNSLWNVELTTGKATHLVDSATVVEWRFSPEGKYLLMLAGGMRLVEWKTGMTRWVSHTSNPAAFAFSPGGELIAHGLSLMAVSDLFHASWTDHGKALGSFKGELTTYAGKIRANPFPRNDLAMAELAQTLPQTTHLALWFSDPKELTAKGIAQLKEVKKLEDVSLMQGMLVPDTLFEGFKDLNSLKRIYIEYSDKVTGSGLEHLQGLKNLESLEFFYGRGLLDEGLKHIGKLKNLRRLDLRDCGKITDEGMAHLAGLTAMCEMTLGGYNGNLLLTGAALAYLKNMTQLEKLTLIRVKISADQAAHLAGLTRLVELKIENGELTDEGLEHLAGLTALKKLELPDNPRLTGKGFAKLKGLTNLEVLNLKNTGLNKEGATHLKPFINLRELSIFETHITDAGMTSLGGLTRLRRLEVGQQTFSSVPFALRVRGNGLQAFKDCKELDDLFLYGPELNDNALFGLRDWKHLKRLTLPVGATDRGLIHLKGLENLEELNGRACVALKGDGLMHLKGLTKLNKIDLSKTDLSVLGVTDEGMKGIKELTQLEELHLMHTKITDTTLNNLHGLTNLRHVTIPTTTVTQAGIDRLKKALPRADIIPIPPNPF